MWECFQPGSGRDQPSELSQESLPSPPCSSLLLCEDPQNRVPPQQQATIAAACRVSTAGCSSCSRSWQVRGQKRKGELGKGSRFFFFKSFFCFFILGTLGFELCSRVAWIKLLPSARHAEKQTCWNYTFGNCSHEATAL